MSRVLIVLGVVLCLYLGYEAGQRLVAPTRPEADGDTEHEFDALSTLQDELLDDLQQGASQGRMPGLEGRSQGFGLLRGIVRLHCEGEPRPLPGIEVRLLGHDGTRALTEPAQRTGQDGGFTFTDVPAHVGYVLIVDQAPYRRVILQGNAVYADKATDVGVILLGAPTSLQGEVLDAKGRPLVGATVRVLRDESRQDSFDAGRAIHALQATMSFLAEAEVGADGRFTIEALSPGRYVLRISAPGYATTFKSGVLVTIDERSSTVRVILDAGVGFQGRIVDESGRGVADARVIAVPMPSVTGRNRLDRFEVRSAGDGSYRLDTLVSGTTYTIDAWAEGYAPTAALIPTGTGIEERDFQLRASGRIEGRLVDAVSGAGIPDAEVTALVGGLGSFSPVSATTDQAGGFTMAHVAPGPVFLFSAKASGYQPRPVFDFKSVEGLHVVGGATTWIDWRLTPGARVFGEVTADGRPVPYAELALVDRNRGRQQWTGEITGMTDIDGRYELLGIQAGDYDLQVRAAGLAAPSDPQQTLVTIAPDLVDVPKDVRLVRGATVRGDVKGPAGEAVRGARVTISAAAESASADVLRDLAAVTGASGAFTISGIPAGIDIVLTAAHDAWAPSVPKSVRLSPGASQSVTLTLRRGVSLSGRVEDERGGAVADALVRWGPVDDVPERDLRDSFRADGHLTSRAIRSDQDGQFVVPDLPPGRLLVKVSKDGYAAWYQRDVQLQPDGEQAPLTAVLVPTQEIRGRVRAADTGRPLAGAFVVAEERGPVAGSEADPGRVHAIVSTETEADGSYVLENVPPGTHRILVWFGPPGYAGQIQGGENASVRRDDVPAGARGVDFALAPLTAPESVDEGPR
jgi:protocatechuate 3,4-dioxygenase beta subunit